MGLGTEYNDYAFVIDPDGTRPYYDFNMFNLENPGGQMKGIAVDGCSRRVIV